MARSISSGRVDRVESVRFAAVARARRWCDRGMLHSNVFQGCSVLEFAAGTGIPGIVASYFAKSVHLTDFAPEIVANLQTNVVLNSFGSAEVETGRRLPVASVHVQRLDWNALNDTVCRPPGFPAVASACTAATTTKLGSNGEGSSIPQVDIIIGSDFVCKDEDCVGATRVIVHFLKPSGTVVAARTGRGHTLGCVGDKAFRCSQARPFSSPARPNHATALTSSHLC